MAWVTLLTLIAIVAVVFGLVIAGMAVGVIFSNRQIKGSCGGLSTMQGGSSPCMVCGGKPTDCDEATRAECESAASCDAVDCEALACDRHGVSEEVETRR